MAHTSSLGDHATRPAIHVGCASGLRNGSTSGGATNSQQQRSGRMQDPRKMTHTKGALAQGP